MTQNTDPAPAHTGSGDGPAPAAPPALPTAAVDALLAFSDAVSGFHRPDEVVSRLVATAAGLIDLPWAILMLRDTATQELRLVATHGAPMSVLPPVLQMPSPAHVNAALFGGPPLVLEDYTGGPPLAPVWWEPAQRLGIRCVIAVPLVSGEEYLGSLHLAGPAPRAFSPVDVALIGRLARLAGHALLHTRTLNAMEQRAGALEAMQALARSLEATLDLDTVLTLLIERAVELTGATGGTLMLWDEEARALVMRKGVNAPVFTDRSLQRGEGVTGTAFATAQPVVQNSYQHFAGAVPYASGDRITNVLVAPLLRNGEAFGTISVFSKVFKPFVPEDTRLLTLFASQAAVAIDNQTLYSTVTRQQRHLDNIIRALHDGLLVYDRTGAVLLINPAAEEMLGMIRNVVGVRNQDGPSAPEDYFRYRVELLHDRAQTFRAVLEHGVTLAGMARIHSDPVRTVEAFYSPYWDEAGTTAGVIAVFRDVSATQELERLRAELEVARRQDDFVSIAAHELRTPITAIKGFGDLLRRRVIPGYVATERDEQMLASQAAQVIRLSALVEDLLEVGRIQAGRLELRPAEVSVRAVVQAALESVRPMAGARESDLILAGDDVWIVADEGRLEQVFINLLTNALKYSAQGPITCTIVPMGDCVRVQVADHGAGIPAAELPRLFERFYRAHDVYTHQRGLGLGLYISRTIVERHEGRIWAESELGQGSTFIVELPLAAPALQGTPPAEHTQP